MKVVWSVEALDDLDLILSQVGEYAGWASAERYLAEFENIVSLASDNPRMGKIGSTAHDVEHRAISPQSDRFHVGATHIGLKLVQIHEIRKIG